MRESVLYDPDATSAEIDRFLDELVAFYQSCRKDEPERLLHLVGIRSRGDTLAKRLAAKLEAAGEQPGELGVIDITLYRDDFSPGRLQPMLGPSEMPFDVDHTHLILIDDVFQTGRTIRAALNQISDYGRPHRVTLAVFIDRVMRELPIRPDFTGLEIARPPAERVQLLLQEDDGEDHVISVRAEESP
ncbi:MAG: bifunctional pyr operon transcriptional regulator/uracil phosphoribosyltransferase PyrR [Planctomycetota bacterium]